MNRYLLIIVMIVSFSIPLRGQSYESCIDSIDRYIEKQNWAMAETSLLSALKQRRGNPSNFILLSNLGTVHRNMGKLDEALKDYKNALAITPNAVAILRNRALLYIEMDSLENAYYDYDRILALDKTDLDAKYYHGMLALGFGEFEIAKGDFEEALKINKEYVDAKRGMALLYKIKNDYVKAIEFYSEVIKKENRPETYLSRAECYIETGQLSEAGADLMEAQKVEPANPDLYVLKAALAEKQYRFDDAEKYAREAISLGADRELVANFFKKKAK